MFNRRLAGKVAGTLSPFLAAAWLSGCGVILTSGGDATLEAADAHARLKTKLPMRVYRPWDSETADVYMTDLPPEVWNGGADVSNMTGVLVHLHMFIRPKAGRTPIADTATTATIRCLVLAKGEIGIYGGGGFYVNGDEPGDERFDGSVRAASLRLIRATGGFEDRLGSVVFSGEVSGKRDDETAGQMDQALRALAAETQDLEP